MTRKSRNFRLTLAALCIGLMHGGGAAWAQGSAGTANSGTGTAGPAPERKLDPARLGISVPANIQTLTDALGLGRQRLALVINAGSVRGERVVDSAPRDSEAVAAALRKGGYVVMKRSDVLLADMRAALREFRARLEPGGLGIIYVVGLGVQVEGQNLLLPRDATLDEKLPPEQLIAQLKRRGLPLKELAEALASTPESSRLLVIDAAYQHPALAALPQRGLAEQPAPPGVALLLSAAPGTVQEVPATAPLPTPLPTDPRQIAATPFASTFVGALVTPRLKGPEILRRTRIALFDASNGEVAPWMSGTSGERDDFAVAPLTDLVPRTPEEIAREAIRQAVRQLRDGRTAAAAAQAVGGSPVPATATVGGTTAGAAAPAPVAGGSAVAATSTGSGEGNASNTQPSTAAPDGSGTAQPGNAASSIGSTAGTSAAGSAVSAVASTAAGVAGSVAATAATLVVASQVAQAMAGTQAAVATVSTATSVAGAVGSAASNLVSRLSAAGGEQPAAAAAQSVSSPGASALRATATPSVAAPAAAAAVPAAITAPGTAAAAATPGAATVGATTAAAGELATAGALPAGTSAAAAAAMPAAAAPGTAAAGVTGSVPGSVPGSVTGAVPGTAAGPVLGAAATALPAGTAGTAGATGAAATPASPASPTASGNGAAPGVQDAARSSAGATAADAARPVRGDNGVERPGWAPPRVNEFGHAEGDTLTYQVTDTWRGELQGSYVQQIDQVLPDGGLSGNGAQMTMDPQGRLRSLRNADGSLSQFEPYQDLWWSDPQVGMRRDLNFIEKIQRPGATPGTRTWEGSARVGRAETVRTPAGEFEALPIESSGWFSERLQAGAPATGRWSRTVWYSPKLGRPVAIDIQDLDRAGRMLRRERVELLHAQSQRGTP